MTYSKQGYFISFLIHGIFILALYLASSGISAQKPERTIDLSILESVGSGYGDIIEDDQSESGSGEADLSTELAGMKAAPDEQDSGIQDEVSVQEQIVAEVETKESSIPEPVIETREGHIEPGDTEPEDPAPVLNREEPVQHYPVTDQVADQFEEDAENYYPNIMEASLSTQRRGAQNYSDLPGYYTDSAASKDNDRAGVGINPGGNSVSSGSKGAGGEADSGEYYLKTNYNRVRTLLGASLVYPKIARRMGWSGEVHVSFLLKADGSVEDVTVSKSCGFPVLDKSAVKTIQKAAPYPRPGASVTIIIPIAYNLD